MENYLPFILIGSFFGGWAFDRFLRWLEKPKKRSWQDIMADEQNRTFNSLKKGLCGCNECIRNRGEYAIHMVVCPTCGNKRCPKANNHIYNCTNSNEAGQPGSAYE